MRIKELKSYFKSTRKVMRRWRQYRHTDGKQQYWHITNDKRKNYLLVAHIDTVQVPKFKGVYGNKIYAQGLDDRLGVAMAFKLWRERSDCDVLITDDEEIGKSTAGLVSLAELEGYNCIIELDRAGNDFVSYGLADDDLLDAFEFYAKKGWGSFSDICSFNERPCGCINVGIGYERAHSLDSYADLEDVNNAFINLNEFMNKHNGVHFKECEKPTYYSNYRTSRPYTPYVPTGYWDKEQHKWIAYVEETKPVPKSLAKPDALDPLCESCGCDLCTLEEQYSQMCKACVQGMFGEDWESVWPGQDEIDDWVYEAYENILEKERQDTIQWKREKAIAQMESDRDYDMRRLEIYDNPDYTQLGVTG